MIDARPELLFTGGTLVDGTGAPGRPAAIAVFGDRVRLLDPSVGEGGGADSTDGGRGAVPGPVRPIDARGLVVAPGFIDLHSHSGLVLLADPLHEAKVRQGVTTEVIGVDGLSYAPIRDPADLAALVEMNAGLDGLPPGAPDWSTVASYLARLDRRAAVNVAFLVGNSALRIDTIGWADRPATKADIDRMRGLLVESMEDGAFALSSGLDYPPGAYATTGELVELAVEAARHGGFYHSHVRYPLGDRYLDPFREAIDIGRRSGAGAHITHFFHRRTFPGGPEPMLGLVDDARAEGLDVTFDAYPYEWASTRLLILVPIWAQEGGPGPTKDRLADRSVRARIRLELAERGVMFAGKGGLADIRLGAFSRPENLRWEGCTLGQVVAEMGTDVVDTVCDLLLSENLRLNEVTPGPNLEGIRLFYRHPAAMVGTDSTFVGAKPSPRTYGSYPRILGQFVREEALLGLEDAVHRMTGAPAARLGLRDRGVLRDGSAADIVVFDPERVRSNATYEEPCRYPDGIEYVVVNGDLVVDRGEHTGRTPGRALRRGRD